MRAENKPYNVILSVLNNDIRTTYKVWDKPKY